MKIRTGFVSNSSSSSYIVCGWRYPYPETMEDMIEAILKIDASQIHPDKFDKEDDDNIDELNDVLCETVGMSDNFLLMEGGARGLYAGNIKYTSTDVAIDEQTVEEWQEFLKPFPPKLDTDIESHFPKVIILAPNEW